MRIISKIGYILALLCYYGFCRYVPDYPFKLGKALRYCCCRLIFARCGRDVWIKRGAFFGPGHHVEIGDNSDIGRDAYIAGIGRGGRLVIGNNVMMAPDVLIYTRTHAFENPYLPINQQGSYSADVVIEDDVWIGTRSTILAGVTIGKGAVVGACALVPGDVPGNAIVGGVPARVIRMRGKKRQATLTMRNKN